MMIAKTDLDPAIPFDDVSTEYAGDHECIRIPVELLPDIMTQVDILHPHYLMEPNIQK